MEWVLENLITFLITDYCTTRVPINRKRTRWTLSLLAYALSCFLLHRTIIKLYFATPFSFSNLFYIFSQYSINKENIALLESAGPLVQNIWPIKELIWQIYWTRGTGQLLMAGKIYRIIHVTVSCYNSITSVIT